MSQENVSSSFRFIKKGAVLDFSEAGLEVQGSHDLWITLEGDVDDPHCAEVKEAITNPQKTEGIFTITGEHADLGNILPGKNLTDVYVKRNNMGDLQQAPLKDRRAYQAKRADIEPSAVKTTKALGPTRLRKMAA